MKLEHSSFSVAGKDRPNQDCVLSPVEVGESYWCAIADGVSGRPDGERASKIAVTSFKQAILENPNALEGELVQSIRDVFERDDLSSGRDKAMATTFSALMLQERTAKVVHLGDTRVYHLRNEGILKRTKDQTEVQDLIDRGVINKRQAARYQRRHVINGFLSSDSNHEASVSHFDLVSGDRIVLLTDGVYDVVPLRAIRDISLQSPDVSDFAEKLRNAVIDAGVVDDYTALILSVTDID